MMHWPITCRLSLLAQSCYVPLARRGGKPAAGVNKNSACAGETAWQTNQFGVLKLRWWCGFLWRKRQDDVGEFPVEAGALKHQADGALIANLHAH